MSETMSNTQKAGISITEISDIEILPIKPKNGVVAYCSFVFNNSLYVGDVGILICLSNQHGYRLLYPDRILVNGRKVNCVHPIHKEVGEAITKAVVAEYKALISRLKGI